MSGPVLVTGAGGFVGRHVCAALTATGAEIIRSEADITNRDELRAMIGNSQPGCCLHLAAIAAIGVARAEPDRAWAVNLHGTLNVAEAIRDLAPHCRMVFISSADIYGASFRAGMALDEQAPPAPLNTYGATKAAADLALGAMAAEGLSVLRLRPFNHTGPGQSPDFVVPAFARQIARIETGLAPPVIKVGALNPERDFLDVRDVARAYALAIAHAEELPGDTILNIASGTPRRIGDVLATLLALAKVEVHVEEDPARLRPSDIPRAIGDAARARALLGWRPAIPWAQTLADVLNDWRARVRHEEG
ncbi:GDP-mannose 4,6-dehydratase [Acidocella aromatica]|uniref:GDP-4-dehydro-6-deoxy-D-mannose reductase n=1 Tax=Acidocella aromatica TaxID=1303579 RepID=A0A840VS86_9PROT|nr:GDP-mannose 4,6-dehydratase [Acidocella aromatica]MBB5374471.1 GDP-4-dehydro-6-deoxy-D-mannose reductase [Acidocella aromatica]